MFKGHDPAIDLFGKVGMSSTSFLSPGSANATFCPHGFGCRSLVLSEDQAILGMTDSDITVTVHVPDGKIIWLVGSTAFLRKIMLYMNVWYSLMMRADQYAYNLCFRSTYW